VDDGLPGAIVFAIAPSRDGGIWAGTTLGLARIPGDKVHPVAAMRGVDIRALYEAPDGRLWIGQRSGLRCLHDNVLDTCGTDGLAQTSVFAFHPTTTSAIWLGTSEGLILWRDGKLVRYDERIGLHGDAVFTILDVGAGYFWISSNRGIARIAQRDIEALDRGSVKTIEPTWFGKSDGMLSAQGNGASQTPGWRTSDGRLWIGTTDGVIQIDPTRLSLNTLSPLVSIERVLADGKLIDSGQTAVIGPGVNRLEFHYAGMSYMAPEKVRYRYRLDGYDRDWVDAGAQRAAYYTNLPPGDYVFHAIASNNDGLWNKTGAQIAFSIQPRLQETTWFRLLLAFAALISVAGLYRLRLWRVRANERALTHEVALRTDELRAANAELRRFASLDGLTRIANRGAFDQALAGLWEEHRQRAAPLAVLLCDIDMFKAYNDSYGHVAGDAALIRVAATLVPLLRSRSDLAARYGGEELVLLLADCAADEAAMAARNLLNAVRTLAIEHRASNVASYVSISIGVAVLVPTAAQTPDLVVRRADEALYRAKAEGCDRICGPDIQEIFE
jgi:diguanylate cyclase (GGDEF)-like protein